MLDEALVRELQHVTEVRLDEPLSRHTTFGIGGPADAFVVAKTADELRSLLALCYRHHSPFFLLGAGSNILVSDKGIRGVTIENRARQVAGPEGRENGSATFRVESGTVLASLARDVSRRGYAGLQWAGGIPGTVGGAVVYNAGANDGCIADVLLRAGMVNGEGREYELAASELGLGYRESAFTRRLFAGQVILWAELKLVPDDAERLLHDMTEFDRSRKESQPRGRSAGSVFKNPRDYMAWWLIDQVGLRGHRIGEAEFSEKHPNFIMNVGNATAADVMALIELARERVQSEYAIKLQTEVAFVGEGF